MTLCAASARAQAGTETQATATSSPAAQALWKSVVWGNPPDPVDLSSLPEGVRARAETYVHRYAAVKTKLQPPPEAIKNSPTYEWVAEVSFGQKIGMEKAILALLPAGGNIAAEAAAFIEDAPHCYEWEGMSQCPLDEARYAENYLAAHLQTALRPYLLLLLMHRYRSAGECFDLVQKPEDGAEVRGRYERCRAAALRCPDPFVSFLAQAMDQAPFVYTDQFLKKAGRK